MIAPNDDAKVILKAYTLIAKGISQSEALKEINKGEKKLSKSNISLILRNPVYKGKIIVPKQDNEPEQLIEGLHEGIVSEDLFDKVQLALNRKLGRGINKVKEWVDLPLRGFIECSSCGKTLTGSGSRSRSGDKYFYYHCFDGCSERHSAARANEKIEKLISLVQFPKEITEVLRRTLKDSIKKEQGTNEYDRNELQERLTTLNEQEENIDDLFLLQKLDSEKYSRLSERIKLEKLEIKEQVGNIKTDHSENDSLINKAVKNLQIFSKTYLSVGIGEKRRMLGSMFPEKIKISDGELRTTRLNSIIELILLNNKELKGQKKGQNRKNSSLSRLVGYTGFEPVTSALSRQRSKPTELITLFQGLKDTNHFNEFS